MALNITRLKRCIQAPFYIPSINFWVYFGIFVYVIDSIEKFIKLGMAQNSEHFSEHPKEWR
jgi:hypothetical protein